MRRAGQLTARCLDMLTEHVQPGVPTDTIDRLVHDFALDNGALPATLMYRGYKKSTCTSLNHVVCHGIPGDKPLKDGDIVNIDVTLILDGWHGDSSRMYPVGDIPPNIVHVGRPGEGVVLKPGMFFTVEPMINLGRPHVKVLSDGWTAVTRDRSLSAQFEHSVGVTQDGVEVFTFSPAGLDKPPYKR